MTVRGRGGGGLMRWRTLVSCCHFLEQRKRTSFNQREEFRRLNINWSIFIETIEGVSATEDLIPFFHN